MAVGSPTGLVWRCFPLAPSKFLFSFDSLILVHIFQITNSYIPLRPLCGIVHLIYYKGKIVIPALLQKHVTAWYHTTLCHSGINRTEETIGQHLWGPKMQDHITNYVKICPLCQRNKRKHKIFGLLPLK
jgi:Integrase zinc binding domain